MLILQNLATNSGKNPHYRAIGNDCVNNHFWVVNLINENIQVHTGLLSVERCSHGDKWWDEGEMCG